jgi:uncharacterized membrane protein SpoIIM required for sporulation
MNQQTFQERNQHHWKTMRTLLDSLDQSGSIPSANFPEQYRLICHHLALARRRRYSTDLVEGLNRLALRGHQHLYRTKSPPWASLGRFVGRDFPRAVRRQWRLLLWSTLLFVGPGLGAGLAITNHPELAYSVLGPAMVAQLDEMYDPKAAHTLRGRPTESDVLMFGFYIRNNIGIGFRTFAAGILFGLGSAFFLVFNGLMLGGAAGYINSVGYFETFYPFVVGHGALELTAIVLAGLSGLQLGLALLRPGRRSRIRALQEEGRRCSTVVFGFAGMLALAAVIEAFWSSSAAPITVKFTVGAALWTAVLLYFLLAGRRHAP